VSTLPTPPLSTLYLYLTDGCNLACRHCWLAPRFDPGRGVTEALSIEVLEGVLREARPLGLQRVKLTGGEPLLHPRIGDLLEVLRREELALTVETNGTLLTEALAEAVARFPRRSVSVSIDGTDAATHDGIRGVRGSFEAAQRAVRTLAASATPPQVVMSLVRRNADQVEPLVRMADSLGASSVKFNVVQPIARGEALHGRGEALTVAELVALGRRVETELAPSARLPLHFDYPPAFRAISRMARGDGGGVCGILGILGVLAGGQYALCGIGGQVPDLVFGQAGEDRLEDVWNRHPRILELRAGLPERLGGVCRRCLMKRSCLGCCVAQNEYQRDDLFAGFWFCEEAMREGVFPESRLAPDPGRAT